MKNLKNLFLTGILGAGLVLSGDSYSQTFEKTKGQIKQYNEKGQLILTTTDYYIEQYNYDDKGQLKTRLSFQEEGVRRTNAFKTDSMIPVLTIFKYNKGNSVGDETYIDRDRDGKVDLKKDGPPITFLEFLKTFSPYKHDLIATEEKRISETKLNEENNKK